jgi:anthranilate/para-aminobenzoate synthase component II
MVQGAVVAIENPAKLLFGLQYHPEVRMDLSGNVQGTFR